LLWNKLARNALETSHQLPSPKKVEKINKKSLPACFT